MRQAPGELGKIQWDAASGRSAVDNLPPEAALFLARDLFASILKRIEALNDRYYPVQGDGVESVRGNEGQIIDLNIGEARNVDVLQAPTAAGLPLNVDNVAVQYLGALSVDERVGLDEDAHAAPDCADVVSLFERRLDRIFGRS